jgi:hypothetical protein
MSSRQEETERRRAERIAAEEAAAKAAARKQRLGIAAGVGLAAAAVIAVVIALSAGGKDPNKPPANGPPIPAQKVKDLTAAAKAAGCTLRTFVPGPNDRQHTTSKVKYKENPPVFGPHYPIPASDGDYVGQGTPDVERLVHPLEHGRVEIQYKPGLAPHRVKQLETLLGEKWGDKAPGYKQLLFENKTSMPFEVAATSWGQQMGCATFTDATFDALRAFREKYVDKGPELVAYPE